MTDSRGFWVAKVTLTDTLRFPPPHFLCLRGWLTDKSYLVVLAFDLSYPGSGDVVASPEPAPFLPLVEGGR